MKKEYEQPILEIVTFDNNNITCSVPSTSDIITCYSTVIDNIF